MLQIFISLLKEIDSDVIVDRSMDGFLTAAEMITELENKTERSKDYVSEVLRISRDFIVNQKTKKK